MENPPGETELPYDTPPYSMREIDSIYLALSTAGSTTERKQILTCYGLSVEHARELFRGLPKSLDPTAANDFDVDDD